MNDDVRRIIAEELNAELKRRCDYNGSDFVDEAEDVLAALTDAGYAVVERNRFERLRAYVVADQEFSQSDTWSGIWSDDDVTRAAVNLQYAGRKQRRREAHYAITLGDVEPLPKRGE